MNSVYIVLFSIFAFVWTKNLPKYITYCHRNDPHLSECLARGFESARPHLAEGIPELRVPSMEPLVIKEMTLEQKGSFKIVLTNVQLYHMSEFKIDKLDMDFDKQDFRLALSFPRMSLKGTYNIKGKLLVLSLDGSGPMEANFTNMQIDATIQGGRYEKNGKTFVNFDKMNLKINPGRPVFRIDNLFKDNQELNDQTNKVINDNIDGFIAELSPVLRKVINDLTIGMMNRIFSRWSLDELFPK